MFWVQRHVNSDISTARCCLVRWWVWQRYPHSEKRTNGWVGDCLILRRKNRLQLNSPLLTVQGFTRSWIHPRVKYHSQLFSATLRQVVCLSRILKPTHHPLREIFHWFLAGGADPSPSWLIDEETPSTYVDPWQRVLGQSGLENSWSPPSNNLTK